ncbi:MAG: hypothetical protein K8T89_09410 [Planctomycetes bacterium]|nr:hypothetical protein [Planctomycetota bacterium]
MSLHRYGALYRAPTTAHFDLKPRAWEIESKRSFLVKMNQVLAPIVFALVVLSLNGCSDKPTPTPTQPASSPSAQGGEKVSEKASEKADPIPTVLNENPSSSNDSVTGKVTLDGKPLSHVLIRFHSGDIPGSPDETDNDGKFDLLLFQPGTCKVTIEPKDGAGKGPIIPAKYQKVETTPLSVEIKKGPNVFSLVLTEK